MLFNSIPLCHSGGEHAGDLLPAILAFMTACLALGSWVIRGLEMRV